MLREGVEFRRGSPPNAARLAPGRRASCAGSDALAFGCRALDGALCLTYDPFESHLRQIKYGTAFSSAVFDGGEGGIRTLGTLRYTRFPSERTRPLCDLSANELLIGFIRRNFSILRRDSPATYILSRRAGSPT